MNRWTVLLAAMFMCILVAMGCSGGGSSGPLAPPTGSGQDTLSPDPGTQTTEGRQIELQTQTHLWGFYNIYIDIETQTVEYVVDRQVMFCANVVQFLNKNPALLGFDIVDTPVGPGYTDVNINVSLTHPLSGMPDYRGYDVRGIFMPDGAGTMAYNSDLKYPVDGTDQYMFDADGYSRWMNPKEFITSGLLGYLEGIAASGGYEATARLNPYMYFADGLGISGPDLNDDLWTWLEANPGTNGVFTPDTTNTRNYYLRFPDGKGISYDYAVIANWESETEHPSNAIETVATRVTVDPDIYWFDAGDFGGDLKLAVDVWSWSPQPSVIIIESSVLSSPYTFAPLEMDPTGGTVNWSTYEADIPADNITHNSSTADGEIWVICQYDEYDYNNDLGVPNLADTDLLAAFFRYPLYIHWMSYNKIPVIISGVDGNAAPMQGTLEQYTVNASDADPGDILSYNWTVTHVSSGIPDPLYNGDPGDGNGALDIDWSVVGGAVDGVQFDIDCDVTDTKDTVSATTLTATVFCSAANPISVSPNTGYVMEDMQDVAVNVAANLMDGPSIGVSLFNGFGWTIVGTDLQNITPTGMTADFDLDNAHSTGPQRLYYVEVTNGCGTVTQSPTQLFIVNTPTITLAQPNGGELWNTGTSYNINWSSVGITEGGVDIDLSLNNGGTWSNLFTDTPDDGTEPWTPPGGMASTQCLIRVSMNVYPAVNDVSNAVFTIRDSFLTVTAPNGGESLVLGSAYNITWTGQNLGPTVNIYQSTNGGTSYPTLIASGVSSTSPWSWTPLTNGTAIRIRVTSVSVPSATDDSDGNFTVYDPWKNINVTYGTYWYVVDLAVNPVNGNVLVLYYYYGGSPSYSRIIRVRRYTRSSNYSSYLTTTVGSGTGTLSWYYSYMAYMRIDCNNLGHWTVMWRGYAYISSAYWYRFRTYNGASLIGSRNQSTRGYPRDMTNFSAYGSYANDMVMNGYGNHTSTSSSYYGHTVGVGPASYNVSDFTYIYYTGYPAYNRYRQYYAEHITEDPRNTGSYNYIWLVHDYYHYANRWRYAPGATITSGSLVYAGPGFGSQSGTTGNTGWTDPRDATTGKNNRLYILDYYSTFPYRTRLKGFNMSTGSSVGVFDPPWFNSGSYACRVDGVPAVAGNTANATMAFLLFGGSTAGDYTAVYLDIYRATDLPTF